MANYQLLCYIVVAALGINTCRSEPSELDTRVPISTLPSLVKEVEDNSRYKTLEANATLLKLLVDDKDGVSRSEVFDMLHSRDEDSEHVDLPPMPQDVDDTRADIPAEPNAQIQVLQSSELVRKDSPRLRYRTPNVGFAAGVMIIITCSLVGLAYTSLIVWRRIYLKRNGLKHELLRNEENVAETRIEL